MQSLWKNREEYLQEAQKCLRFSSSVIITDHLYFRQNFIDTLIYNTVFGDDENLKQEFSSLILSLSQEHCPPSSHKNLYQSISKLNYKKFSSAALNIRTLTFEIAFTIFQLMKKHHIGAVIFEIARSEMEYTDQRPQEFASSILAGALKADYKGPVFLQGDHFQVSMSHFIQDSSAEMKRIENLISEAIDAHFLNIDIDASTLVDLSKQSIIDQQKMNSHVTAQLTKFIRAHENSANNISIGGEIGHIGDKNSSVEDFETFMSLYLKEIPQNGLSKVSVQTGSSHGGKVKADGSLEKMNIDFSILENIGGLAKKKYGLAGAVQHGASTLELSDFQKFPKHNTAEVHLATGLQNIFFESLPDDLKKEVDSYVLKTVEKKDDTLTAEQFLYKNRKFAFGPFKQVFWDMTQPEKAKYFSSLENYLEPLLLALNLENTIDITNELTHKT